MPDQSQQKRGESPLISLAFNIVLPALILYKLSGENSLGPVLSLGVALSLPLGYGSYDFVKNRKTNAIAILGFVSVLLTGGFGANPRAVWYSRRIRSANFPGKIRPRRCLRPSPRH